MSAKTEDLTAGHILAMKDNEREIAVRNWAVSPVSCQETNVDGAKVLQDQRMLDAFPWLKNATGLKWAPDEWEVTVNGTPTPRDNELLLFCQSVSSMGQKKQRGFDVAVIKDVERSSANAAKYVEHLVVKGKEMPIGGATVVIYREESSLRVFWSLVPPTASFAIVPKDDWFDLKQFEGISVSVKLRCDADDNRAENSTLELVKRSVNDKEGPFYVDARGNRISSPHCF